MDRKLIERLVALEWEFFQATRNEGGRAPCQDNWETFRVMRTGQAMGWSEEMAAAWLSDLEAARAAGRNPVTEKYARMMAFTAPEAYAKLAHFLPPVEPEVEKLARALTDQTVAWADAAAQLKCTPCQGQILYADRGVKLWNVALKDGFLIDCFGC